MKQLNKTLAIDRPTLAGTIISAIIPLQEYLLTADSRINASDLWKLTIGHLQDTLLSLTNQINDVL